MCFFEMVDCGKENKPFDKDLSELEEQYENMTDNKSAAVEAVAEEDTTAAITVDADIAAKLREAHPGFGKPYKIDVAFTDEMLENGYDPITLYSNIREISDYFINIVDVSSVPSSEEIEPYKLYLRPATYIISDASIEELLDLAFEPDIMTVHEISLDGAADEKTYVADEPSAEESEIDSDDSQEVVDTTGIDEGMLSELAVGIEDYFESIENYLIDIEKTGIGSKDAVDNIFRVFHNIKGDSGYVGFAFMEKYAHLVENMLDKVRDGSVEFDKRAAEFILNVISDVKTLVNDLVNKKKPVLPKTYSMLTDVSTNILEHTEKSTCNNR